MSAFKGRINSGVPLHAANSTRDYMSVSIKEEYNDNYPIGKTAMLKPPSENFQLNLNLREDQNVNGERSRYFKMNSVCNSNEGTNAEVGSELRRKNANVDIRKQVKLEHNEAARRNQNGKQNLMETVRVFTGTVDRAIRWQKICTEFYYVEVFASVISIQEGNINFQKIILLKDRRGPILQVQHYANDHIDIQDFYIGQELRCVGHMVGPNVLHAVSIRTATVEERANLQRLYYICDHAIARSAPNS